MSEDLWSRIQNLAIWYREEVLPKRQTEWQTNWLQMQPTEEETILDGMEEWIPHEDQELVHALETVAEHQEVQEVLKNLKSLENGYPNQNQEQLAISTMESLMEMSDSYMEMFRDHSEM